MIKDIEVGRVCKLRDGSKSVVENITKGMIVLRDKKGELSAHTLEGRYIDPDSPITMEVKDGKVSFSFNQKDIVKVVKNSDGTFKFRLDCVNNYRTISRNSTFKLS